MMIKNHLGVHIILIHDYFQYFRRRFKMPDIFS